MRFPIVLNLRYCTSISCLGNLFIILVYWSPSYNSGWLLKKNIFLWVEKPFIQCSNTLDRTQVQHVALFVQVSCQCPALDSSKVHLLWMFSQNFGANWTIIFLKGSFCVCKDISFEKWGKLALKIHQYHEGELSLFFQWVS